MGAFIAKSNVSDKGKTGHVDWSTNVVVHSCSLHSHPQILDLAEKYVLFKRSSFFEKHSQQQIRQNSQSLQSCME